MTLSKMARRRPVNTTSWKSGSLRQRVTRASLSAMRPINQLDELLPDTEAELLKRVGEGHLPHALLADGIFLHLLQE